MTLADYMALDGPKPTAHIAYGTAPSQYAELFLPKGAGPFPVVFLVHGGCWQSSLGGIRQMHNMAGDLESRGVAVWNVEYRRVDETGGGYPGMYQDINRAYDTLIAKAPALSSRHAAASSPWVIPRAGISCNGSPAARDCRNRAPSTIRADASGCRDQSRRAGRSAGAGDAHSQCVRRAGGATHGTGERYASRSAPRYERRIAHPERHAHASHQRRAWTRSRRRPSPPTTRRWRGMPATKRMFWCCRMRAISTKWLQPRRAWKLILPAILNALSKKMR